jgi:hypothetical protein
MESRLGVSGGRWQRFDIEGETVDGGDTHTGVALDGGGGVSFPYLPVYQHLAIRLERLGDDSDLTEEGVDAHQGFVVAGTHGEPNEKDGDESEGDAGGDGGGGVDAHLRHRAGDKGEHADHETDDAGEREHAMAGELDFEHHQDGGGEQQHDGGVVHGQQIEREEREQDQ